MNAHNEQQWPEYLMLRDTGLADDAGGLGQRIFTTAGAGYVKQKYVRADIAAQPAAAQEAVGVDAYDDALDQLWKLAGGNDHPVYKRFLEFRETFAAPVTAAPVEPLKVFSEGPWVFRETGQEFSGADLDEAAFVEYRRASTPAAPGIDPKHDAENWGDALNEAGWTFLDACPEKSSLLFNNCKPALRAAILKYLERIDASPKGDEVSLDDLPGMWEKADLVGGATDAEDSPKGGSEARDAARWRYVRRKLCLTGNGDGTCGMQAINLPGSIPGWPDTSDDVVDFCEAAIDAAMQAQASDAEVRP